MCDGFLMKLVVPFVLRNSSGHGDVEIRASLGSADSGGIFLDSTLPPNAGAGLPICTANIVYEASGYAAAMGWVQLVHSSDSGIPIGSNSTLWPCSATRTPRMRSSASSLR